MDSPSYSKSVYIPLQPGSPSSQRNPTAAVLKISLCGCVCAFKEETSRIQRQELTVSVAVVHTSSRSQCLLSTWHPHRGTARGRANLVFRGSRGCSFDGDLVASCLSCCCLFVSLASCSTSSVVPSAAV